MRKRTILLWVVAAIALVAGADSFPYLKLVTSTGTTKTVATDKLKVVFEDGNLVATNAEGTTTVSLASLDYMEFSTQAAELKRGDINGDGSVDVTDLSAFIDVMLGNARRSDFPGDCNLDGDEDDVVDVSDLSILIDIILGSSTNEEEEAQS